MASITQRGNRFLVRVRRDGYASIAKTFTRKIDGQAWGRRVEADMEAGRWVDDARKIPSLAEAVADYRDTVAVHMKGASDYAYRFKEIQALPFATKRVDQVTPFDIAAWRDADLARLKPATVVRKLALLSGVFTWCVKERGWIVTNPLSLVRKPRVEDGRDRTLSADELSYLTAAAATSKAEWLLDALTVLLSSAMRRNELFTIQLCDIDVGNSVVFLPSTKNGSARTVPLCPVALQALERLAAAARTRNESRLLPLSAVGSISTRFKQTVLRARHSYCLDQLSANSIVDANFLANLRLHDLRHHAVSYWANIGELTLVELMTISGHKTARCLTRYTHINTAGLANKLAKIRT